MIILFIFGPFFLLTITTEELFSRLLVKSFYFLSIFFGFHKILNGVLQVTKSESLRRPACYHRPSVLKKNVHGLMVFKVSI